MVWVNKLGLDKEPSNVDVLCHVQFYEVFTFLTVYILN